MNAPVPIDSRVTSERLVMFTDAVAAIGLTLLVLPLVEIVPDPRERSPELGGFLLEHLPQFGAFALSFGVIFRFWWAHHRLFRHIRRVNLQLVALTAVWCFGIVFLPVPTAIITSFDISAGTVALYISSLLLLSASLALMSLTAFRHPELSEADDPVTRDSVLGSGVILAAQVLALILGTVFAPHLAYWPLALMLLAGPVDAMVKRRWRRTEQTRAAAD